jgi:hypothetical protein
VREQIIRAAVLDNKAVAFGVIEPFDLALRHDELPCSFLVGRLLFVLESTIDGFGQCRFDAHFPGAVGEWLVTEWIRQLTRFYIAFSQLANIRSAQNAKQYVSMVEAVPQAVSLPYP